MEGLKNKRGQLSLLWNIIIGLVFLVIAVILYIVINILIADMGSASITEAHALDLSDSYSGVLAKSSKQNLRDFASLSTDMRHNDEYYFLHEDSIKVYSTYEGDIINTEGELERSNFVNRGIQIFYSDGQAAAFNFFGSISATPTPFPECPFGNVRAAHKGKRQSDKSYCWLEETYD